MNHGRRVSRQLGSHATQLEYEEEQEVEGEEDEVK